MDLSVNETAEFLGVSPRTIYRWVKSGSVPYSRVGAQYRFSKSDLLDWAATHGEGSAVDKNYTTENETLLLDTVRSGGIFYNIDGDTPGTALEELVGLLRLPASVSPTELVSALLERESMSSTGIGDGIALPHPRNPLHGIQKPQLSVAFLRHPIDWKSVDNRPVRVLFLALNPNVQIHLQVLSRLHYLIHSEPWQNLDMGNCTRKQVMQAIETTGRRFLES